jgi:cardiolipin synthase A/B
VAAVGARYGAETMRHRREQGHGYDLRGEALEVGDPAFLRACEALTGAPIAEGNTVELLVNGDEIFPAFLDVIRGAEHTIELGTYAYWRGDIAREVAETLCERARAGVEVSLLMDWMGSIKMDFSLLDVMADAGIRVARFRPPRPYAMRRLNNRTHRKILVADGTVGMTGGVGIAKEWTGDAQDPDHWRDTHMRIDGPVVRGLHGAFAENWLEATGEVLVGPHYLPDLQPVEGGATAQLVRSRATVGDTNVEALYFLAIASARRTIDLTAAYFAPRPAFIEALADAARRDVAVRVLVPGPHIDKEFVRLAGRDAYDALLEAGVRLWEYQPTMLHAKTLTIDGVWSSVGSVNFDNRSFQLHDEATLCIRSEDVAARLGRCFEADLERSDEMTAARWDGRTRRQKAAERTLRMARREL